MENISASESARNRDKDKDKKLMDDVVPISHTQVEILRALVLSRKPLRPTDILNKLPSELDPRSSTKLYYHLETLKSLGLIENKKITHKLSLYSASEKGINFVLPSNDKAELALTIAGLVKAKSKKSIEQLQRDLMGVL